jgi:hypothetical protein
MKKEFNPFEWIDNKSNPNENKTISSTGFKNESCTDLESIIQEIEMNKTDIAPSYLEWRNVGFALADKFQEEGREYFHRISQFNSSYNQQECDDQFNSCLNSKGNGITMKTFFFQCKQAGINIYNENIEEAKEIEESKDSEIEKVNVPLLPDDIFPQLPNFLQKVIDVASNNEERDLLLLGSIVSLSSCLPKIFGFYDGKKVFANLFLFITAQASAGKGRLVHCKQLVQLIHKKKREESKLLREKYEVELQEFNRAKKNGKDAVKPLPPPEKMLFIPANNSATGAFQLLNDNRGSGLIFETEGDTLAQAFKSDYGNYSDGFRKAFHHETISYYRRTDREYVDIENPCLACLLSGTPKQISALIPNAENGLFSRFMFYYMNVTPTWKNVFESKYENGLDSYFDGLGQQFFNLYDSLLKEEQIQFKLTKDQELKFNQFFDELQTTYLALQSYEYMATVRRLGLIAFRIAMLLRSLRILESGDMTPPMICQDNDFNSALQIIRTLVKHASKVFSDLPEDTPLAMKKNQRELFLEKLPQNFNRQGYLEVAKLLEIADKTAEGYISKFVKSGLLFRLKQDSYEKTKVV